MSPHPGEGVRPLTGISPKPSITPGSYFMSQQVNAQSRMNEGMGYGELGTPTHPCSGCHGLPWTSPSKPVLLALLLKPPLPGSASRRSLRWTLHLALLEFTSSDSTLHPRLGSVVSHPRVTASLYVYTHV